MSEESDLKKSEKPTNLTEKPKGKRGPKNGKTRETTVGEDITAAASIKSKRQIADEKKTQNQKKFEAKTNAFYSITGTLEMATSRVQITSPTGAVSRNKDFVLDEFDQTFTGGAIEYFENENKRGAIFLDAIQMELLCKVLGLCKGGYDYGIEAEANEVLTALESKRLQK